MFISFFCENVLVLQVMVNIFYECNPFAVPECNKQIIRVWDKKKTTAKRKILFLFKID